MSADQLGRPRTGSLTRRRTYGASSRNPMRNWRASVPITLSDCGWPAVSSRHNLPVQVTGLIGRERDIADIKQLAARRGCSP